MRATKTENVEYMKDVSELGNEELRKLSQDGVLASRWCARCDKHYRFCQCQDPEWKLLLDGELSPLPGQPGGPRTMQEEITGAPINWPWAPKKEGD